MYHDYLTNTETYSKLEKLFIESFWAPIKKSKKNHYIAPFYKTTFNNGQPFRDANPIFSAINTDSKNIIRIIITEDDNYVSIVKNNTDHGDETIIFGGLSNLPEILNKLKAWTVQPASQY